MVFLSETTKEHLRWWLWQQAGGTDISSGNFNVALHGLQMSAEKTIATACPDPQYYNA